MAPAASLGNIGGSIKGTVTLSAPASDTSGIGTVTFQRSADGGTTWTAFGTSTSTTRPLHLRLEHDRHAQREVRNPSRSDRQGRQLHNHHPTVHQDQTTSFNLTRGAYMS